MRLNLKRNVYTFENYNLKKIFNYYIIEGFGNESYNTKNEDLETKFKELCNLGKKLYLQIEGIDYFSKIFIKKRKDMKIVLLSLKGTNTFEEKNNIDFNLYDDIEPNTNHVIKIKNYDKLIEDKLIFDLIIDFCHKNGLPYYENIDKELIEESHNNGISLAVRAKDLIFTSITIYVLAEIKKIIDTKLNKNDKLHLNNIMGFNELQEVKIYVEELNYYIKCFKQEYYLYISSYKQYNSQIINNLNENYIETNNLVQAIVYYFLNCVYLNSTIFNICHRCSIPTIRLTKNLCSSCFNEDPNFHKNNTRNNLNNSCKILVGKLKELNNEEINKQINNTNAIKSCFKDSSKNDEMLLIELCKNSKIL